MFRSLQRRDEAILAACEEPSERARAIAEQVRYRAWFVVLGLVAAVVVLVASFLRVEVEKPLISFVLVLTAAVVGVSQSTTSIRLLRFSEWIERRLNREMLPRG